MKTTRRQPRSRFSLGNLTGTTLALGMAATLGAAAQTNQISQCEEHLKRISQALIAYQNDRHKLPPQLSDLCPAYLPDQALLHCASDPSPGDPGRPYAHKDPALPVSYSYEFSADESNGLPSPQGPFPKPDIGNAWGSWRLVSTHQRTFFGDQVPVVRCFHHKPVDSDEETVLNLTLEGKIYQSGVEWENHPDTVAVALQLIEHDLAAGPGEFKRRRYLGRFEEYTYGWSEDPRIKPLHGELCRVAELLDGLGRGQADEQKQYTLRVEARLLNAAKEYRRTIPVMEESIRLLSALHPDQPEKREPWSGARGEIEMLILADAYEGLGEYEHSIPLIQEFLRKTPDRTYLMGRLAKAYRATGQNELADQWELKTDPGKGLVGQKAPDFSLKTPTGRLIRLPEVLRGHKAVLLNFWFYGCHPCRVEFPQLQRIYQQLRGQGFELVAINQGDSAERISTYLKENNFSFQCAINGSGSDDIGKRYKVGAYPTSFLLDGTGKILWRSVGFDEKGLLAALAKIGLNLH